MSLSQTLADDARVLFASARWINDPNEKLRIIRQAVELLDDAVRIRHQAIELQLVEIKKAQKEFDSRLPQHLRLF